MKRTRFLIGAAGVVALVGIQWVPVPRSNPPVEADIDTPVAVKAVLRRACYDCHSNETRWPWYSRIAPASWLIAWDVRRGRAELNFSNWSRFGTRAQVGLMEAAWKRVDEGEMPLRFYLPVHPEARLSAADRATLREWAQRPAKQDEWTR